jgi:hypothetical protein
MTRLSLTLLALLLAAPCLATDPPIKQGAIFTVHIGASHINGQKYLDDSWITPQTTIHFLGGSVATLSQSGAMATFQVVGPIGNSVVVAVEPFWPNGKSLTGPGGVRRQISFTIVAADVPIPTPTIAVPPTRVPTPPLAGPPADLDLNSGTLDLVGTPL